MLKEFKRFCILILSMIMLLTLINPLSVHAANEDLPKFCNSCSDSRYEFNYQGSKLWSVDLETSIGFDYSECGTNKGYDIKDIKTVKFKDNNSIFCSTDSTDVINGWVHIISYQSFPGTNVLDCSIRLLKPDKSNFTEKEDFLNSISKSACSVEIIFNDGSSIETPLNIVGENKSLSSANTIVSVYSYDKELDNSEVSSLGAENYYDKESNTMYVDRNRLENFKVQIPKDLTWNQALVRDNSNGDSTTLYNNGGFKVLDDWKYNSSFDKLSADKDAKNNNSYYSTEDSLKSYLKSIKDSNHENHPAINVEKDGVKGVLRYDYGYKFFPQNELTINKFSNHIDTIKLDGSNKVDLLKIINSGFFSDIDELYGKSSISPGPFYVQFAGIEKSIDDSTKDLFINDIKSFVDTLPKEHYGFINNKTSIEVATSIPWVDTKNCYLPTVEFYLNHDELSRLEEVCNKYEKTHISLSNTPKDFVCTPEEYKVLSADKSNPFDHSSVCLDVSLKSSLKSCYEYSETFKNLLDNSNWSMIIYKTSYSSNSIMSKSGLESFINSSSSSDCYSIDIDYSNSKFNNDYLETDNNFTINVRREFEYTYNYHDESDVINSINSGQLTLEDKLNEESIKDYNLSYEPYSANYATVSDNNLVFKKPFKDFTKVGGDYTIVGQIAYNYDSSGYSEVCLVNPQADNVRCSNLVFADEVENRIKSNFNKFNDFSNLHYSGDSSNFIDIKKIIDYDYLNLKVASVPSVPQDLKANVSDDNKVSISWSSPSNQGLGTTEDGKSVVDNVIKVDSYKANLYKKDGEDYSLIKTCNSGDEFNDLVLEPDTTYKLDVTASNLIGEGEKAESIFKTNPSKPEIVPKFTDNKTTTTSIEVTWKYDSEKDPDKFSLTINPVDDETDVKKVEVPGDTYSRVFDGLTPDTEYHFTVIAIDQDVETPADEVNISTDVVMEDGRLDKPLITSTDSTINCISYDWTYNGKVIPDNYEIGYLKSDDFDRGKDIPWTRESMDTTSKEFDGLEEDTLYRVFVRVSKNGEYSDYNSALIRTKKSEKPEEPVVDEDYPLPKIVNTSTTCDSLFAEWEFNDNDFNKKATSFEIGITEYENAEPIEWIEVSKNDRSHTFNNLKSNTVYYIKLRAVFGEYKGEIVSETDTTLKEDIIPPKSTVTHKEVSIATVTPQKVNDIEEIETNAASNTVNNVSKSHVNKSQVNKAKNGIVKTSDVGFIKMYILAVILAGNLIVICFIKKHNYGGKNVKRN